MACSCSPGRKCPPPFPFPPFPFPFPTPVSPSPKDTPAEPVYAKGDSTDYEWDGDYLLLGIACICVAILVILTIYYMYDRLRQREVENRGALRRLRISRSRGFSMRPSEDRDFASPREGLRSSMVDALPVFHYRPENSSDGLRCAVCLCEFQEKEKAKLLPTCKHSFHVDCIDMWFHSHSTCPLCRARVDSHDPLPLSSSSSPQEEVVVVVVDDKVLLTNSTASPPHDITDIPTTTQN